MPLFVTFLSFEIVIKLKNECISIINSVNEIWLQVYIISKLIFLFSVFFPL